MCMSTPTYNAPEAPKPEVDIEARKNLLRDSDMERRRRAAGGIRSTILTGPGSNTGQSQYGKTLLGQ